MRSQTETAQRQGGHPLEGKQALFWNTYLAVAIMDRIMLICNERISIVNII